MLPVEIHLQKPFNFFQMNAPSHKIIIYRIAASAASHSTTLSVGKTKAKKTKTKPNTTTKKAQSCYVLPLISLSVFKILLTQIAQTPTSLLADIISEIKSAKGTA